MHIGKPTPHKHAKPFTRATLAMALGCLAAPLAVAVDILPRSVTFEDYEDTATITITQDGEPVPASAITSWTLMASGHDYDHMMSVHEHDGKLTISPTRSAEIGSFDLIVTTAHGKETIKVYTPLDDLPSSLENRAETLGITVEELKDRYGLGTRLPERAATYRIPAVAYPGETVYFTTVDAEDEGITYQYSIEGQPVAGAPADGETQTAYVFEETGTYIIAIDTFEDEALIGSNYAMVDVVDTPGVDIMAKPGEPIELTAPEGYSIYEWKRNGDQIQGERRTTVSFDEPGGHTVTVTAMSPAAGKTKNFNKIRFDIEVPGKK